MLPVFYILDQNLLRLLYFFAFQGALSAIPDPTDINKVQLLEEMTPLGRMLVNLPVDVAVGKMLIMGCLFQQVAFHGLQIGLAQSYK